jgi:hypothetical protein
MGWFCCLLLCMQDITTALDQGPVVAAATSDHSSLDSTPHSQAGGALTSSALAGTFATAIQVDASPTQPPCRAHVLHVLSNRGCSQMQTSQLSDQTVILHHGRPWSTYPCAQLRKKWERFPEQGTLCCSFLTAGLTSSAAAASQDELSATLNQACVQHDSSSSSSSSGSSQVCELLQCMRTGCGRVQLRAACLHGAQRHSPPVSPTTHPLPVVCTGRA